ncbi:MAG: PhzF family phenazine biosynthesis protein [Candidatus Cyclobacteriaceae bacterium M3_2C_046]
MPINIYQVDAFASKVFAGNPAAVCPLDSWLDTDIMQKIAAENNLSETAFLVREKDQYQIRWFTPLMEVDLCGHATLASAHVIFQFLDHQRDEIIFSSQSGTLKVQKEAGWLWLDFPARPPEPTDDHPLLIEALGLVPSEVLKSRDYLVRYQDEAQILKIKPDFAKLSQLDAVGIIITAPGENVDFVSRFFAPRAGINEDPVTGSAHCTLIPYWAKALKKQELSALQLSVRGGEISCRLRDQRVLIGGEAVTYLQGVITI